MKNERNSTGQSAVSTTAPSSVPNRVNRRAVVGGVMAGATGLAVAAVAGWDRGVHAAQATAQPDLATPAASPVSSPIASPASSPTPSPSPTPVPLLTVVTEQQPTYAGPPLATDQLNLFVATSGFSSFNPTAMQQDPLIAASYLDPLAWANDVTMEPEPALATSWSWNKDGTQLTINLRQGVKWHDGTAFTAKDVAFSLGVYMDDYDSGVARFFVNVDHFASPDANTLRVVFSAPDGAFVFNALTLPIFQRAQYTAYWEANPAPYRSLSGYDWSKKKPIGTGPWKVDAIAKTTIDFVANASYWDGAPYADKLVLTAEDDAHKRIAAWKSGTCDVVYPLAPGDLSLVLPEKGNLYVADSATVMFAAFNFNNPANATPDMMKDTALRQALTLAVDRTNYQQQVFQGYIDIESAGTVTQPWAHDQGLKNPARNVKQAAKLLADGGWSDSDGDGLLEDAKGNKLDLYCIVSSDERPELLALLDLLNANFNEIGARLTVQRLDPDAFLDRWMNNRQYDMIAYTLVQYPAFVEYDLYGSKWDIQKNHAGWNPGAYSDAKVDAAIDSWLKAFKTADMEDALTQLQENANSDLFGLWFGFPKDLVLVREEIQGYQPNKLLQTINTRLLWRQTAGGKPVTPAKTPAPAPTVTPTTAPAKPKATVKAAKSTVTPAPKPSPTASGDGTGA